MPHKAHLLHGNGHAAAGIGLAVAQTMREDGGAPAGRALRVAADQTSFFVFPISIF